MCIPFVCCTPRSKDGVRSSRLELQEILQMPHINARNEALFPCKSNKCTYILDHLSSSYATILTSQTGVAWPSTATTLRTRTLPWIFLEKLSLKNMKRDFIACNNMLVPSSFHDRNTFVWLLVFSLWKSDVWRKVVSWLRTEQR